MDKARIAEWLLTRVTTRHRASEIVGDLLEQRFESPDKISLFAFWSAVARILLVLGWRPIYASAAAIVSAYLPIAAFASFAASKLHASPHFTLWMRWSQPLHWASICIWVAAALATVLFGLRDVVTKVALAFVVILISSSYFASLPSMHSFIVLLLTLSVGAAIFHPSLAKPFLCVVLGAASFASAFAVMGATMTSIEIVRTNPTYNNLAGIAIVCISVFIATWILKRVRSRHFPLQQPPGEAMPLVP